MCTWYINQRWVACIALDYQYQYVILSQVDFTSLYCSVRFFCAVRLDSLVCFVQLGFLRSQVVSLVCIARVYCLVSYSLVYLYQYVILSQVGFTSLYCSVRFFCAVRLVFLVCFAQLGFCAVRLFHQYVLLECIAVSWFRLCVLLLVSRSVQFVGDLFLYGVLFC